MPGISIHVVDVSRGLVAEGMWVELFAIGPDDAAEPVVAGSISATGVLDHPGLAQTFGPGTYEARFHAAAYYREAGVALPAQPFLDIIRFRFGLANSTAHYHLPMKCTPWGYSCFRGGA